LLAIPDEEWQAAVDADLEREQTEADFSEQLTPWGQLVAHGSDVMKLAHGAAMQDETTEQMTRGELTAYRARAYEKELATQAQRVGCDQYSAPLRIGPEWVELDKKSIDDARSITNTYNRDLAREINKIRKDVPTANRNTYAKRIEGWSKSRKDWKDKQIIQYTNNSARNQAQRDFYRNNGITEGTAVLRPRTAVCPICNGWINRGEVPLNVALANPANFHPNCPHYWDVYPPKLAPDDCGNLWRPGIPPGRGSMPSVPEPEPIVAEPVYEPTTADDFTKRAAREIAEEAMERYHDEYGISVADWENKALKQTDELLQGDILIRRKMRGSISVLEDGRFKTQFESGRSGGMFDIEARKRAEKMGMGIPRDIDPRQRPVYGVVSNPPGTVAAVEHTYGPVEFKLKPSVRRRTTYTVGDSFGGMSSGEQAGVLVNDGAQMEAIAHWAPELATGEINVIPYIEAQIQGGVTLDDVAEIVLHKAGVIAKLTDADITALEQLAKSKGIKTRMVIDTF